MFKKLNPLICELFRKIKYKFNHNTITLNKMPLSWRRRAGRTDRQTDGRTASASTRWVGNTCSTTLTNNCTRPQVYTPINSPCICYSDTTYDCLISISWEGPSWLLHCNLCLGIKGVPFIEAFLMCVVTSDILKVIF